MARLEVIREATTITKPSALLAFLRKQYAKSLTGTVLLHALNDRSRPLLPGIGRPHAFAGHAMQFDNKSEAWLLRRFRRTAQSVLGCELSAWETMFLAHAHGLPVRLINWTTRPFSALHSACYFRQASEFPNDTVPDAAIWVLIPRAQDGLEKLQSRYPDPLKVRGLKQTPCTVTISRMKTIAGLFTIQENPWIPLDQFGEIEFSKRRLDFVRLIELIIPARQRAELLVRLSTRGTSRVTNHSSLSSRATTTLNAAIIASARKRS